MTATPAVEIIPKRKSLSNAQRVYVFDSNLGVCHLCKREIDGTKEKWEAEHVNARGRGGGDDYRTMKPAHVECHKPKTAEDKKVMAETTRIRAAHLGITKDGPPIQSPGFVKSTKAAAKAARGSKPPVVRQRPFYQDITP